MPMIKVTLTEPAHKELLELAKREKRTINAQASYMLENSIPALKMRRVGEANTVALRSEE